MPFKNLVLRDDAQEAAERTTQAYHIDRLGGDNAVAVQANMNEAHVKRSDRNQHATKRCVLKINL